MEALQAGAVAALIAYAFVLARSERLTWSDLKNPALFYAAVLPGYLILFALVAPQSWDHLFFLISIVPALLRRWHLLVGLPLLAGWLLSPHLGTLSQVPVATIIEALLFAPLIAFTAPQHKKER